MDVETASALERVTERIDALEHRIERLRTDVSEGFVDARLRDERLRAEVSEGLADARRHAVMLNENTRDDIRLVAEAVAVLAVKVDALDSRLR